MYHENKEENKLRYRKFSTIRYSKVFRSNARCDSIGALLSQKSARNDRKDTLKDKKDHIPDPSKLQNNEPTSSIKVITVVQYCLCLFLQEAL
jgi:hypothetical protein